MIDAYTVEECLPVCFFFLPGLLMKVPFFLSGCVALGMLAASTPAFAQAKQAPATAAKTATNAAGQALLIGTFGDWKALTSGKDRQKVCYVMGQPKERLPDTLKRDPAYLFISNRPADQVRGEVAFQLGFGTKKDGPGVLQVGTSRFAIFGTGGENAFLKEPAQEGQLVEALKKASAMSIEMASARGNKTTDKYVLTGLAKALEAIAKECP